MTTILGGTRCDLFDNETASLHNTCYRTLLLGPLQLRLKLNLEAIECFFDSMHLDLQGEIKLSTESLLILMPQSLNLFGVVAAVEEMEFSPLVSGKRAEDGMVQQLAEAEAGFALGDDRIHGGDGLGGMGFDFLRRQASGSGLFGSDPAFRQVVEG
jgi:hypothetical protein